MRQEARDWWQQGLEDLETAKALAHAERHYACAFFCQQAAEKVLKALFIESQRQSPPLTHTLPTLGRKLGASAPLLTALRRLNLAYTTTRYPDAANGIPAELFDRDSSTSYLTDAQKVVDWVRERLKSV